MKKGYKGTFKRPGQDRGIKLVKTSRVYAVMQSSPTVR